MRIVFACDHKWRDLPALVVIKIHLENLGYKVWLVSPKELDAMLPLLQPDLVVLNHFWDERYRRLAQRLRAHGIAVGVLPTEGAIPMFVRRQMVTGAFTDFSLLDFHLCWNEGVAEGIAATKKLPRDRLEVVGCPRYDFAREPLHGSCLSRDQFCQRFNLDPKRPIITWASRFAIAKKADASPEAIEAYANELGKIGFWADTEGRGHTVMDLIRTFRTSLDAFVDACSEIALRNPEMQFVFKPHPGDDVSYIERRLGKALANNVTLCLEVYIGDVLRASDVVVNSNCTTSIEAWVLDIPVVDVQIIDDKVSGRPDIQAGNRVARTIDEVEAGILSCLVDKSVAAHVKEARDTLIAKSFYRVDGQRCRAVADAVDRFLKTFDRTRRKRYPIKLGGGFRRVLATAITFWSGAPAGTGARKVLFGKRTELVRGGVFDKSLNQRDVSRTDARLRHLIERRAG